jgi:hypothetical protein
VSSVSKKGFVAYIGYASYWDSRTIRKAPLTNSYITSNSAAVWLVSDALESIVLMLISS